MGAKVRKKYLNAKMKERKVKCEATFCKLSRNMYFCTQNHNNNKTDKVKWIG